MKLSSKTLEIKIPKVPLKLNQNVDIVIGLKQKVMCLCLQHTWDVYIFHENALIIEKHIVAKSCCQEYSKVITRIKLFAKGQYKIQAKLLEHKESVSTSFTVE